MFEKFFEFAASLFKDPAYQPFSIGFLILIVFLFTYEKAKSIGLYEDITSLFRSKKNQLKILKESFDSNFYNDSEKEQIKYDIKVIEYQILLNSKSNHLPLLIYLNGFINPRLAATRYNKCSRLIEFKEDENNIYKFSLSATIKKPESNTETKTEFRTEKTIYSYILLTSFALIIYVLIIQFKIVPIYIEFIIKRDLVGTFFIVNGLTFLIGLIITYIMTQSFNRKRTAILLLRMERKNEA